MNGKSSKPPNRSNLFGQITTYRGEILGCDACPMNKVPGVNKVKGLERIKSRKAMLWTQSPGKNENLKFLELVGRAGQLLWTVLKEFDLGRNDVDVQNVMRCYPIDAHGQEHDPTPRELACCSIYNAEALERNAGCAAVHVVMGDVAGQQLLGDRFKKDKPVFWYEPWNAYVVLNQHPSYILRIGGKESGWEYYTWRDRFRAVREIVDHPGRWGYVKSRDYRLVRTMSEFDVMEKHLRQEAADKRRVSFDIEDGFVDSQRVILLAGFGTGHYANTKQFETTGTYEGTDWHNMKERWVESTSYSVVLDHPESGLDPAQKRELKARTVKLIADRGIKKALQNGSYDSNRCKELLGARVEGYNYDTQYGTYLQYSFLRSCSLENLTYRFHPEFCDYKEVTAGYKNYADVPLDMLLLRNGGDLEITKRLEERIAPKVSFALVQVYIHAGFTLDAMEKRGPRLDWETWNKAEAAVGPMMEKLDRALYRIANDGNQGRPVNFDCDSPQQVAWLIYDKLGLPEIEGRSTKKGVLQLLMIETGNKQLELIIKRRALGVIKNTFLTGYAASARLNEDELRTIWWLTGAVTGRLRSGKGDQAEAKGIINFQNLHGNPLLQNLLVSDKNWREALEND